MTPSMLLCHIRGIDSLAAALQSRVEVRFVTLHEPGSIVLRQAGIEHTPLDAFLSDALLHRVLSQAETRLRSLAAALGNAPAAWPALSAAMWARLAPRMMQTLQRDLPEQMAVVEVMRLLAADYGLRLVITPEDVTRDTRTAVLAARALGIPSLHVLHGVNSGAVAAHASVAADRFAVYSAHTREHYLAQGVSPDRMVVTGNPAWDAFARPLDPVARARYCGRHTLDESRPIIVYAMTSTPPLSTSCIAHADFPDRTAEAVVVAFAELALRHPDWQFVLVPHPSQPDAAGRFVDVARSRGLAGLRTGSGSAYECVLACDVLVCTHSNMGIEAILAGKPVVNAALDEVLGDVFLEGAGPLFHEDDAVLWARSSAEIAPAIERALLDGQTQDRLRRSRPVSIERFNGVSDGRAMDRVCDLALSMAGLSGLGDPGGGSMEPSRKGQVKD